MSNELPVVDPDTILGLAPDCRRTLREEYQRILSRISGLRTPQRKEIESYDAKRGLTNLRQETVAEARARTERERGSVGAAIAEYRRVAALWGVDVEAG